MEHKLKTISRNGIPEAISKAELYRFLNEPEESESICHDILAIDPENQTAIRILGLAITDEFTGESADRYAEAEGVFLPLLMLMSSITAWACSASARPRRRCGPDARPRCDRFIQEAMGHFEAAEKIRPPRMMMPYSAGTGVPACWKNFPSLSARSLKRCSRTTTPPPCNSPAAPPKPRASPSGGQPGNFREL